jgi:menaquinone-dependent protoporphyrinogen oxidase
MSLRTLVLYASEQGTTKAFAELIAKCLSAAQPPLGVVTCLPVSEAPIDPELGSFDVIVLGSAIHQQSWLPDMITFLSEHMSTLESTRSSTLKPRLGVYAFSVGCPAAMGKLLGSKMAVKEEKLIREKVEGSLGLRGILKQHTLLQGKMEKSDIPWDKVKAPFGALIRGIFWVVGGRWGDYRDEKSVEAWANNVLVPALSKIVE